MNAPTSAAPTPAKLDPLALAELAMRACATSRPLPGQAMLREAMLRHGAPAFTWRLSRGGWYRPGRILAAEGGSIAEDALRWIERAWAQADEDGRTFAEHHADSGFLVTRVDGVTHYLVAPYGDGPTEFLQLEVEELQEKVSHALAGGEEPAGSVEALLAGPQHGPVPLPLGRPHYAFRRITDLSEFVGRIAAQPGKPAPVLRFLAEWSASSAGRQHPFCHHWVLALAEHPDRYARPLASATPVAARAPRWQATDGSRGTALAQQLRDFDGAAGYPFAWYFHLISGHRVPRDVLPRVMSDILDGLAYLPERDAALVTGWMREPYSL